MWAAEKSAAPPCLCPRRPTPFSAGPARPVSPAEPLPSPAALLPPAQTPPRLPAESARALQKSQFNYFIGKVGGECGQGNPEAERILSFWKNAPLSAYERVKLLPGCEGGPRLLRETPRRLRLPLLPVPTACPAHPAGRGVQAAGPCFQVSLGKTKNMGAAGCLARKSWNLPGGCSPRRAGA